jgi:hypothetical protein
MMMGLYSRSGFEKVLGLGHIFWVPLLAYVLTVLPTFESSFIIYLVIFSISIAISLAFDIIDVWKYLINRKST